MRLAEVIEVIENTELEQIHLGDNKTKVLSLLNLALIDVYAKFAILQEEQVIAINEGQTRYRLQDNSQKVLQVYARNIVTDPLLGDDGFLEVPLNDINCDNSVFTPEPYVLHIPNPDAGKMYSVMQIVSPPYITENNINTLDFIVPPQLLEPLANYVAYRAYKSMNGDNNTEIGSHYRAYVESCNEVLRRGLVHQSILTNTKLTERGFI